MSRTIFLILMLTFSKISFTQPCLNGLQGVLTIGPTGQYSSLTVVFDSLRSKGVSGAVILELQNNYNSSAEIFPIKFTKIACTDSISNIIIRPQVGTTALQISSNDPVATIDFNNGKFITIDGRSGGTGITSSLTISNTNTSGSTIRFINDASWNKIKFLDIQGVTSSPFSGVVLIGGTDSITGNDYNRLDTCRIHSGATTAANLVYSAGAFSKFNTALIINGCELFDFFSRDEASNGINIRLNSENVSVTGNSIYQTSARDYRGLTAPANVCGIRVVTISQGGHVIKNNFIGGSQKNAAGAKMRLTGIFSFKGITIANGSGPTRASTVEDNVVTNIYMRFNDGNTNESAPIELGNSDDVGYFNGNCTNNTIGTMTGDSAIIFRCDRVNSSSVMFCGLSGYAISELDSVNIRLNKIGGLYLDPVSLTRSTLVGLRIQTTGSNPSLRCLVESNTIGSPSVPNSLYNGGRYDTYGMVLFGSPQQSNLIIRSNTICNITQGQSLPFQTSVGSVIGIHITGAYPGKLTISRNKIFNLKQERITDPHPVHCVAGILSWYAGTVPTIYNLTENEIHSLYTDNIPSNGPRLDVLGIGLFEASTTSNFTTNVTRNYIHNLHAKTDSSQYATKVNGIYLEQITNNANVENNMIRLGVDTSGNSYNDGVEYYGIYESEGATNKYLHNTVVIAGVAIPYKFSSAFHSFAPSTTNRIIQNNILVNIRGNVTDTFRRHACLFINSPGQGNASVYLNHNSYYFDKTGGEIGTIPPAFNVKNIADWKLLTQEDSNSIFTNPNFVDSAGPASGRPIHIKSPTAIEGRGSAAYTTSLDFDGDLRNNLSPVDIGADAGDFLQIEPGRAASNILTSNVASTFATVSATSGDGERRLFVVRRDNAVTNFPIDGVGYTQNNSFGAGSNLGNNSFVVADTGSSVTINNLAPGATYHVRVFEFNGRNTSANYLTTNAATTTFTTQSVTAVIDLQSTEYSASVFPNPGKTFWISIQSRRTTIVQVLVYSLSGELLFTEKIPVNSGNSLRELEKIKKYPNGVYVLKMNIGKSKGTAKLIKF